MREPLKLPKPFRLLANLVLILGFGLTGCKTPTTPLANGYEQVTHPIRVGFGEPPSSRISFQYQAPSGQTIRIWPSLYGIGEVINGDVAIFVGDLTYADSGGRVTHPRLFAVQAPGLPVDITDAVLWRWSKANGQDFTTTRNRISLVTPEKLDGRLELHLDFWTGGTLSDFKNWPDRSDLPLAWQQVSNLLQAVKISGVLKKDLRWRTPYIGDNY
jgi:hypothetical protein